MTTLHNFARAAADKLVPCTCIDAYRDRGLTDPQCANCEFAAEIADAMVALARDFARLVLAEVVVAEKHPNMPTYIAHAVLPQYKKLFGLGYATMAEAEEHANWAIDAAIAAAEAGK